MILGVKPLGHYALGQGPRFHNKPFWEWKVVPTENCVTVTPTYTMQQNTACNNPYRYGNELNRVTFPDKRFGAVLESDGFWYQYWWLRINPVTSGGILGRKDEILPVLNPGAEEANNTSMWTISPEITELEILSPELYMGHGIEPFEGDYVYRIWVENETQNSNVYMSQDIDIPNNPGIYDDIDEGKAAFFLEWAENSPNTIGLHESEMIIECYNDVGSFISEFTSGLTTIPITNTQPKPWYERSLETGRLPAGTRSIKLVYRVVYIHVDELTPGPVRDLDDIKLLLMYEMDKNWVKVITYRYEPIGQSEPINIPGFYDIQ